MIPLTAVQGPNPKSVVFLSPTHKSTTLKPITQHLPSHCSPRTHPEFSFFISFPDPKVNNNRSHYSAWAFSLQSKGPPQLQVFFFPRSINQQQPIPLLNMILLIAVQGPNPNSVFWFLSQTQRVNNAQSHYSTSSLSLQSKDPPRIQFFYFFPRPKSQQQPIPLFSMSLLIAIQGPTPTSGFFLSPVHKSTATDPITQHDPSHCSPRTQPEFSVLISFPDPKSQQHPIPLLNIFLPIAVQILG